MMDSHSSSSDEPMTFLDKVVNLFAAPGDLFAEIARTGQTSANWLIPWLIYVFLAVMTGQIVLQNASLSSQFESVMRTEFEKSVEPQIREGNMTRQEADEAFDTFASPRSPWFMLMSTGGTLFISLLVLFVLSLVGWLLGRSAMGATAPFMKVAEVVGMIYLVAGLEQIVNTGLMLMTDSIYASASLAMFLYPDVDLQDRFHLVLSKINLFTIWSIALGAIGLGTLFARDTLKVLALLGFLWLLWIVVTVLDGPSFF